MKALAPLVAVLIVGFGLFKGYSMHKTIQELTQKVEGLEQDNRELEAKNRDLDEQVTKLKEELEAAKQAAASPMGGAPGTPQTAMLRGGARQIRVNCPACGATGKVEGTDLSGRSRPMACRVCGGSGGRMLMLPAGKVVCPNCGGMQRLAGGGSTFSVGSTGTGGGSGSVSTAGGRTSGVSAPTLCLRCSGAGFVDAPPPGADGAVGAEGYPMPGGFGAPGGGGGAQQMPYGAVEPTTGAIY